MSTIRPDRLEVKPAPIVLSLEAVREGRASWRYSTPIDEATAVRLGEASWLSDRPRPITILDDVVEPPYDPSPEDEADYIAWSRERDERLWNERIEAPQTFLEKLYAVIHPLCDSLDADLHGLGEFLAEVAGEAAALEAKSWTQYLDRRQASIDCGMWIRGR